MVAVFCTQKIVREARAIFDMAVHLNQPGKKKCELSQGYGRAIILDMAVHLNQPKGADMSVHLNQVGGVC